MKFRGGSHFETSGRQLVGVVCREGVWLLLRFEYKRASSANATTTTATGTGTATGLDKKSPC